MTVMAATSPRLRALARRLQAAAILFLLAVGPGVARPFTIDDLLREEAFGAIGFDPTGRWVAVEQRVPYETIPDADYEVSMALAGSRLALFDTAVARPAPRWVAGGDVGLVAGDFSPDGGRLAVFRLKAHRWELGVATTRTGSVRWLGVTPSDFGDPRAVQWRSNDTLLATTRSASDVPHSIGLYWRVAELSRARWARAERGEVATTVYGSGAYRGWRERPPPRALQRIDVATGRRMTLIEGEITDFELSPDGDRVAVLIAGPDLQPTWPGPVQGPLGLATQVHELRLVDLGSGRVVAAATGLDVMDSLLAWAPDGRELLVFARRPGTAWSSGGLLRVAVDATARPVALGTLRLDLQERPERVRAAWLGGDPLVLARPGAEGAAAWYWIRPGGPAALASAAAGPTTLLAAARGRALVLDGDRLIRIAANGSVAELAKDLAPLSLPRVRRSGRAALQPPATVEVAVSAKAGDALYVWSDDAERPSAEIALPSEATLAAVSVAGRAAVVRRRDAGGREALDLLRPGAEPVRLAAINEHLRDVDAPRIVPIRHAGPLGEPLTSWLFLPPAAGASPPPLVVRPYLGTRLTAPPQDELGMPLPIPSIRLLVGAGYAVLVPSQPKPNPREPLEGVADRLLAIVDQAVRDPALSGAFDPRRLFIWGQSYGGYTSLAVTTQTDRFLAAAANGAPTQLFSMFGAFQPSWRSNPALGLGPAWPMGWVETAQGGMAAPPWDAPDRYVRNSPALQAHRIRTPILLLHGDLDMIPLAQAEEMFSALYRQDKDAVLVTYWGEAHFLTRPATVRDVYARVLGWFARHDPQVRTRGGPPAANPGPGSASAGSRLRSPPPAGSRSPVPPT